MLYLHPDGKNEVEVNPADHEDHKTLVANGWKPLGDSEFAEAAPKEPKAPKAAKAPKAPKPAEAE